jgi:diaminopimelate epimerase
MTPALVRAICDRHRGVGGDGLLEPFETDAADFGVRIWNPDGSTAEKSGNGLRIFAAWLVDSQHAERSMSLWTGACLVTCDVRADDVVAEMGTASFEPASVPTSAENPLIDTRLSDAWDLPITAVGVGNPHCVVFCEEPLDTLDWRTWGARLETHALFPHRTNVQFAHIRSSSDVDVRIWERGAGETSASGSSSCAVAAAGVKTGRLAVGTIRVHMPGGVLAVDVRADWSLRLAGPVERVGRIAVDPAWLNTRQPRT